MDDKPESLGRNWGEATIGTFGSAPRCQKQPAVVAQPAKLVESPKVPYVLEKDLAAFHPEHLGELLVGRRMNASVVGPSQKEISLNVEQPPRCGAEPPPEHKPQADEALPVSSKHPTRTRHQKPTATPKSPESPLMLGVNSRDEFTGECVKSSASDFSDANTAGVIQKPAVEWNLKLTCQPVAATLVAANASTRTGRKKPAFELVSHQPVSEHRAFPEQPPVPD